MEFYSPQPRCIILTIRRFNLKIKTLLALIAIASFGISTSSAYAAGSSSTSANAGGANAGGGKPAVAPAPVQLVLVLCPGSTYYGCFVPVPGGGVVPLNNSQAETALGVSSPSNQNGKPVQ